MTIETWPSELPRPERDTWDSEPMEARAKRQGDVGPAAYRRLFSSVPEIVSLSIVLSRDQKAVFDRFHRETTKRGSLPFYMPDPTTDGWNMGATSGAVLLTMSGAPLLLWKRWLCLFGDQQPKETIVGLQFRKSFSITVMP